MTTTYHPGGLIATSSEGDDLVGLTIGDALDMVIEKNVLVAIAIEHAWLPKPSFDRDHFDDNLWEAFGMNTLSPEERATIGDLAERCAGTMPWPGES